MKFHLGWLIAFVTFAVTDVAVADDLLSVCLTKYKVMESQFELYNQKSALVNGIMDRIKIYATGEDVTKIQVQDAQVWRAAIEQASSVGQKMLQNSMEYNVSCSSGPNQRKQLEASIEKLTVDLRLMRARMNALDTGFPVSTFR